MKTPASIVLAILVVATSNYHGAPSADAFVGASPRSPRTSWGLLGRGRSVFVTTSADDVVSGSAQGATATPPSWEDLAQSLEDLTSEEEMPEPLVTLYRDTNGWCPFCERVWLILRAKGIPYDEQLISLQNKPEWYKALVPTTLVPAILIKNDSESNERRIVWESTDIMNALEEEFPDTPRMVHDTPEFDAAVQMMEELQMAGVQHVYGGRNATLTDEEKSERKASFLSELDRLDASLQKHGGPFRMGNEFSGVDALLVPTLERWRYQLPLADDPVDIVAGRPGLVRWFEAMDAYLPYNGRVRGDEYSWTATNSMFLRYFGGDETKPEVAAAIQRADDAAERLVASFVERAVEDEDGKYAKEAATKLIANHEAVALDCTRSDPQSQQHIGRATNNDTADAMLRHVASVLLSAALTNENAVLRAGDLRLHHVESGSKKDAALAARTVASRLCAPRDMSAPAASILRAVLASVAIRLER